MRLRRLVVVPLCVLALTAGAQGVDARNPEVEALRAALAALQQEQQSVYQQFQMVQALRTAQQPVLPPGALPSYTPPPTPPSYEDLVRNRQRYEAEQAQYQAELERLYARYRELEEQKRPLLARLAEIASPR